MLRNTVVQLNCVVRSPSGSYRVLWHKERVKKKEMEGYAPLIINNFTQQDQGEYSCQIMEGITDFKASFHVNIVGMFLS